MINIILFSKDRSCQLELLLRSMKRYFKEFSSSDIKILYASSSASFEKGYNQLKEIHGDSNIIYYKEVSSFQNCLIYLFDKTKKYSVFFVDDNVFKEPFSIEDDQFKYFSSKGDILTLSLRLHPRLTYCYPAKVDMKPPTFLNEHNVFNWKGMSGDYGYPMSLDGHIFRTSFLSYYILNNRYNGPNLLESQMASNPLPLPKMMCYDKSIIMNNPLNKVQDFNNNIHGDVTQEYLNDEFLNGKIIDLTPFEGLENVSCHQEIPVVFI